MVKRRKSGAAGGTKSSILVKEEHFASDDISVARDRLRGALHTLLDPSNASCNDGIQKHSNLLKRKQDELTQEQLHMKQEEKKAAVAARRKQRRAEMNQVAYHNSYVMKLFDRSVDLAQFNEGTPLYPICRAWIANQPRNATQDKNRSPSPGAKLKLEPPDELEKSSNGLVEGMDTDGSIDGNDEEVDADLVKDTYKMPLPIPLTFVRYPVKKAECSPNLEFNFCDPHAPSKETLLTEHITRWTQTRKDWINSANENEDRYKRSGRILKAIYEQAQKNFES